MSVEEDFEKWWKDSEARKSYIGHYGLDSYDMLDAYKAGRADERRRCVEIVKNLHSDPRYCTDIVEAIERQEDKL